MRVLPTARSDDVPDPRRSNELALAQRAATGDPHARRRVVVLVHRRVRAIANSLVEQTADADDAAQVALLEILGAIGGYRGEGGLVAWAARLAVRHVRRFVDRRRRIDQRQAPLDDDHPSSERAARVSDDLPRAIRSYLADLPEEQSEALILRFALGFTLQEIADVTETHPSTVRGRIRAGTQRVRATIARELRFGRGRR